MKGERDKAEMFLDIFV